MDELYTIVNSENITIINSNLPNGLKGLYIDNVIYLSNKMTRAEESCVLAEELGHHFKTFGHIYNKYDVVSIKQENLGRAWAFEQLLPLSKFIDAYNYRCRSLYEVADFLEVTEFFLSEAVKYYNNKYGLYKILDNYIVYFSPLGVMEKI
jgi:Zn-dependent peptidase ImmA (M78 family)